MGLYMLLGGMLSVNAALHHYCYQMLCGSDGMWLYGSPALGLVASAGVLLHVILHQSCASSYAEALWTCNTACTVD
jgi:hypothetical protein